MPLSHPETPRFSPSSRERLSSHDLERFPGATLFDRVGRALCGADCLPRKELYENWEVARRVRRLFRGGRVVDLGAGHGLLAQLLLLLDDTSPEALAVDRAIAPSAAPVHQALVAAWPRLTGRVQFVAAGLDDVPLTSSDLVVASHACGTLTDAVLGRAIEAGARVAVLPCCHDRDRGDTGHLEGWLDPALAIDVVRAGTLRGAGYRVWTQTIPATITPKNRLLLGRPGAEPAP